MWKRAGLAIIVLAASVFAVSAPATDLSPRRWGAKDRAIYESLDKQYGLQNVLAEGRSGVIAGTSSASAARAGLEALRQGGSAADAVLTTALVQITQGMGSWVSFAGLMNMVYYDAASGRFYNLNAGYNTVSGETDPRTIPALSDIMNPRPDSVIHPSGRTALVPGFMAGIEAAHKRFGKLGFKDLFGPAVYYAENGFEIDPYHARLIGLRKNALARLPETLAIFTKPDGSWMAAGDVFKQPALAATLRRIADQGTGYMYKGEWGRKLVEAVRRDGGKMTQEDLAKYEVIWPEPIEVPYGGFKIYAPGIASQGGVHVAEAMNVAAQARLAGMGHYSESEKAFFWLSQITNLMPLSFVPPQTVSALLGGADGSPAARTGKEHAARLWSLMSTGRFPLTKVPAEAKPEHSDAVVAIDRWGNAAALVHSSNTVMWGTTGIFVDGVSIPDSASFQQNLIARTGPGQRLPDPTEPLIVARDGKPFAVLSSIAAGLHQKTISVLLNLLDFRMGIKAAVDAPCLNAPSYGPDGSARPQVYEGAFCAHLLAAVRKLGLEVVVTPGAGAVNALTGFAIRGYLVGATVGPDGIYQAVSTDAINSRALGY
jgi:gamma-glutamyltranspeptidase/glutathione hydrolase